MLTFKRALVIALAVITFIILLKSSHSDKPHFSNANQMPRPKDIGNGLKTEESSVQTAAPKGTDSPIKKTTAYDLPPPPRRPSRQQVALQDLHNMPLRDQLEYHYPYDVDSKFPAYIWQTWKTTPASGDFDQEFREGEASWTDQHPTFVHEVITDSVAVHLLRHLYASVPEVMEAYTALPMPVLKADFFRYLILLARGGIYSDIDTAALKPAMDWVPQEVPRSSFGMVIGIEADPDRPDWADWYSRRIQFCQWTIQSKPGHPVLREIVANITETVLSRKKAGTLKPNQKEIVDFTGPALWTDTIFNYFNSPEYFDVGAGSGNVTWQQFTGMTAAKKVGDVIVLPITSFSPGVKQMGAGEDDDPMAFVKHHFQGTWKPESERHIGEKVESQ